MERIENLPDVLETADLCSVLRIGKRSAYKLLSEGVISSCRIGRRYKIPKTAVEDFLRGGEKGIIR